MEETEQILLYWYYLNDKGRTGRIPMYADHALRAIVAAWAEGTVLKDGNAAWH